MIPAQVPGPVVGFAFLAVDVAVVIAAAAAAVCLRWRRQQHDVGPDALKLLEDLDTHLDRFSADAPEIQAGLARLDAAIRQQREESQ